MVVMGWGSLSHKMMRVRAISGAKKSFTIKRGRGLYAFMMNKRMSMNMRRYDLNMDSASSPLDSNLWLYIRG